MTQLAVEETLPVCGGATRGVSQEADDPEADQINRSQRSGLNKINKNLRSLLLSVQHPITPATNGLDSSKRGTGECLKIDFRFFS